ncbi:hypothetical protein GCM10023317_70470 [Actinopolymorpha pittospori]
MTGSPHRVIGRVVPPSGNEPTATPRGSRACAGSPVPPHDRGTVITVSHPGLAGGTDVVTHGDDSRRPPHAMRIATIRAVIPVSAVLDGSHWKAPECTERR